MFVHMQIVILFFCCSGLLFDLILFCFCKAPYEKWAKNVICENYKTKDIPPRNISGKNAILSGGYAVCMVVIFLRHS